MGLKIRRLITWVGFFVTVVAALAILPSQAFTPVAAQNPTPTPLPIAGAIATPLHRINIWAGPSRGFWVLGTATNADALPVTGQSADHQFWQVSTRFGLGWLWFLDVNVTNGNAVPVADTSNVGFITAGIVAVRGGD